MPTSQPGPSTHCDRADAPRHPAIDWTWPPERRNPVLRALWTSIPARDLDMKPASADWAVPSGARHDRPGEIGKTGSRASCYGCGELLAMRGADVRLADGRAPRPERKDGLPRYGPPRRSGHSEARRRRRLVNASTRAVGNPDAIYVNCRSAIADRSCAGRACDRGSSPLSCSSTENTPIRRSMTGTRGLLAGAEAQGGRPAFWYLASRTRSRFVPAPSVPAPAGDPSPA